MGIFSKLGLYARTVIHLKPIQITNRLARKLLPAKVDISQRPDLRSKCINEFYYISRPKSILAHNKFYFLNIEDVLNFPEGWNDSKHPKLWLFNLHYFEGLLNDDTPENTKCDLIEQWISDNPPAKGNGWEPYANSLRICNWIKWALMGNVLSENALQSLAVQSRYLMATLEYHLLANHLFVTLKGVIFAGCYFQGEEADRWLDTCLKEIDRQISEQFLADGAHFELSPTYHALLTEDLLDIINILKVYGKGIPEKWLATAKKALEWQQAITRPDGLPPLFNDAAYGISPNLRDLLEYATNIGSEASIIKNSGLRLLNDSGYFRYDGDEYSLIGDVGQIGASYQPAHIHCDMLSFELFVKGSPLVVDTGTSTYDPGQRRNLERGTAAHNTVQIADHEQSEVWGAFRVGRRARLFNREITRYSIEASHDGYKNLGAVHTRNFSVTSDGLQIKDSITGYEDVAISRLHFHPDVVVVLDGDIIRAGPMVIKLRNSVGVSIKNYEYAPEFNKLIFSKVLEIEFKGSLLIDFKFN